MRVGRVCAVLVVGAATGLTWIGTPAALAASPPRCGYFQGAMATIVGTPGDDRLVGTKRRDVIVGRGGNDVLIARGEFDNLCGGSGDDVLLSSRDGFTGMWGDAGADRLKERLE